MLSVDIWNERIFSKMHLSDGDGRPTDNKIPFQNSRTIVRHSHSSRTFDTINRTIQTLRNSFNATVSGESHKTPATHTHTQMLCRVVLFGRLMFTILRATCLKRKKKNNKNQSNARNSILARSLTMFSVSCIALNGECIDECIVYIPYFRSTMALNDAQETENTKMFLTVF